ncbi:VPLPA-CTERM sorting domain-containing protein [Dinoroseobacter sp. S76]|uniref:VPLPA-CTERM sorting domain-containing protein n=1 Tax=Dinoroseobacter sp. S76 TaxID=3415124 RepID=UPI003C7A46CE
MQKLLAASTALFLATSAAHATSVSLTFDGDACADGLCNADREAISQDYGDIAGEVEVTYDAAQSVNGLQPWIYWNLGYEELVDAAYGNAGGGGGTLLITPLDGFEVSLVKMDIAPFSNTAQTTGVTVTEVGGATETALAVDILSVVQATEVDLSAFGPSEDGYLITIAPEFFNSGVDNIMFDVTPIDTTPAPVPLPPSALMMLAGVAGLGGLARRRRKS